MNKFSVVIAGLITTVAGAALVQFGFSDSCSSEITAKALPLLGMIPGLGIAYVGRIRQGDITPLGFKK